MYLGIKRMTKRGLACLAVIIVVVLFVIAAMMMDERMTNEENFVNNHKTNGEIIDVRKKAKRSQGRSSGPILFKDDVVDVTYCVNGKDYKNTFEYDRADSSLIGQSIEVAYEENDPQDSYISIYDTGDFLSVVTSSQFIKFTLLFALCWGLGFISYSLFGIHDEDSYDY